jgi:hypothetical protein
MDFAKYLFKKKQTKEKQVKIFNLLQTIENNGKYNIKKSDNNSILVEMIHDNFNKMSDEEIKNTVTKCLGINEMKKILLDYELQNIHLIPKKISMNKFNKIAMKYLNRYQFKAGGFMFDDNWVFYSGTLNKYKLKQNESIFENTIYENCVYMSDTYDYLSCIIKLLNSISINVKVTMHTKFYDRDKTYIVMLKCEYKNK